MRDVSWLTFTSMIVCVLFSGSAWAGDKEPFIAGYDRFYSKSNDPDEFAGQLLLTELNCTACHQADKRLLPKGGPELKGAGSRLQPNWIRDYLTSPSNLKPNGTMPHLLHQIPEKERLDAIDAMVAYLSSTESLEPGIVASGANPVAHEFWLKGNLERGRKLYHSIGCVACHALDSEFQPPKTIQSDLDRRIESLGLEPDELEAMGLFVSKPARPVPMSHVSMKYSLRSLSMFLIAPHLVRPGGRMPSLKLQPHEAADIAAYLFQRPDESNSKVHTRSDLELHTQASLPSDSAFHACCQ